MECDHRLMQKLVRVLRVPQLLARLPKLGVTARRPPSSVRDLVHGFCAEKGGAMSLFLATLLGIPVSTTHVITGGIVGVGAVTHLGAVRWRIAVRVVWAWLFAIQCAAVIAAATMLIERAFGFR
jgi:hypothetical protein